MIGRLEPGFLGFKAPIPTNMKQAKKRYSLASLRNFDGLGESQWCQMADHGPPSNPCIHFKHRPESEIECVFLIALAGVCAGDYSCC